LTGAVAALAQDQPRNVGLSPLSGVLAPTENSGQYSLSAMPGGRGAPDILGESLRGTFVVFRSSADTLSASGRAGEVRLGSLPVVLPTGVIVPSKLWNAEASGAYSHRLGDRRGYGLNLGVGSASDDLFHSIHETEIRASAYYQLPSAVYNSWVLMLSYSNNRTFFNNVPLPGAAYFWHDPGLRLDAVIGFPFLSVRWRPDDDWTLSAALAGGVDFNAEAQRRLTGRIATYGRVERRPQQWLRANRDDYTNRLIFNEEDARLGLRARLGGGLGLDVSGGRAFDRQFFEAHDAQSQGASKMTLPDCWIIDARLSWRM
jgi:hypothetical protein